MTEPQISDAEADKVLAGRRPEGRGDLDRVADAMAWLRIQCKTTDPPEVGPDLQERLTVPLAGAAWRARRAVRVSALSLAAAATIVLGLVVSGSQGMLPRPMQTAVADVGDVVGVAFPRPPGGPDVISGSGGSAWPGAEDGTGAAGDGESAADEAALGGTTGKGGANGAGSDGEGFAADRWCADRSDGDWDPGDGGGDGADRGDRDRDAWDRDDREHNAWSSDGRAVEPQWRTGRSPESSPAGDDRGVDPDGRGRDTSWTVRSRGGDGPPDGDDARDGRGWPFTEWCERAGAAGH